MKNIVLTVILSLFILAACSQKPAEKTAENTAAAPVSTKDLMAPPADSGTPMPADHPDMGQADPAMGSGHPDMGSIPMKAPHDMTMGQPGSGQTQRGKVVSSIDVPQFTYIEINQDGKTRWLAATTVAVKKDDTIEFVEDVTMEKFTSKTLNRTFDSLTFVNQAEVVKDM